MYTKDNVDVVLFGHGHGYVMIQQKKKKLAVVNSHDVLYRFAEIITCVPRYLCVPVHVKQQYRFRVGLIRTRTKHENTL